MKAAFRVNGLDNSFLSDSKAMHKEMLPVVDKLSFNMQSKSRRRSESPK